VKKFVLGAVVSLAMLSSAAFAGPSKAPLTAPSANDVTLVLHAADMFEYLGKVNTQGVQSSTPFADEFTGNWSAIGAFGSNGLATGAYGLTTSPLAFTFSLDASKKSGSWSVTNTNQNADVTLDLVFAMHTGGGSGAWLFDNHTFLAGTTQGGSWIQRILNNGNQAGAFSNLTLFGSGLKLTPKEPSKVPGTPVDLPEPATLGTLMLGLGMAGYMSRRRKQS
jgi:hypothetical protein